MHGMNIGLFGVTSTGKSTMVNALLGRNLAETGCGETTTKIKAYPGTGYTLWDTPGRIDEKSYSSKEEVSYLIGLRRRLILIQWTVNECVSLMRLLDKLGLEYDIVFNKLDQADPEERELVKQTINNEIKSHGLQKVGKVYFVSAREPRMFNDWIKMVDHLTS